MTEQKPHSIFAPSASHRWLVCPGSVTLLGDPSEPSISEYAHEGIVCHEIVADCLKNNDSPEHLTNTVVDGVTITPELVEAMQFYIDDIRGTAKEIKAIGGKIEFEVEIFDECRGTLDAMIYNNRIAVFKDLKMGKGVIVEAENNPQLMLYAVGGLKKLMEDHKIAPEEVELHIIQPRTVNPIRVWKISRSDLIKWFKSDVLPAMESIKAGDTTCNPGVKQCRWCLISATCEAQKDFIINETEGAFADFIPAMQKGLLTAHDISLLIPKFTQIQNWINSVQEYALQQALSGTKIPGYKVVEGRSVRKWSADESQVVKFLTQHGVEPYEEKLKSVAKAEKAIGKKKVESIGFEKYINKPPGKPTLVPDTDKRAEIKDTVEQEFKDFTSDEEVIPVEDPILDAWARLKAGANGDIEDSDDDLVIPESSDMFDNIDAGVVENQKIATSGNLQVKLQMVGKDSVTPPKAKTKKAEVLNFGKGGITIKDAAEALECSENMIHMHLRYLNEQHGYGVIVYDSGEFEVTGGE